MLRDEGGSRRESVIDVGCRHPAGVLRPSDLAGPVSLATRPTLKHNLHTSGQTPPEIPLGPELKDTNPRG